MADNPHLFEALIRLADDHLILAHRVSEWCGHAPILEEDLALPNMALDMLGQARAIYTYAGEIEGKGRDEDALAYLRTEREYKNILMVERPNGDFAHTMLRQLYFAAFMKPYWEEASSSSDATIAGIAAKAAKEAAYHVRHAGEWVIRLGDGTEESNRRVRDAVSALNPYIDELFHSDEAVIAVANEGLLPDPRALRPKFQEIVDFVFAEAGLETESTQWPRTGGRSGLHGEEFGHLLSELQYMQRTYPNMTW
ncbi:MAG: 1,2-phenylacetyl-CoA epoxidase subunit PaaC [Pseudomonadota bacterium]